MYQRFAKLSILAMMILCAGAVIAQAETFDLSFTLAPTSTIDNTVTMTGYNSGDPALATQVTTMGGSMMVTITADFPVGGGAGTVTAVGFNGAAGPTDVGTSTMSDLGFSWIAMQEEDPLGEGWDRVDGGGKNLFASVYQGDYKEWSYPTMTVGNVTPGHFDGGSLTVLNGGTAGGVETWHWWNGDDPPTYDDGSWDLGGDMDLSASHEHGYLTISDGVITVSKDSLGNYSGDLVVPLYIYSNIAGPFTCDGVGTIHAMAGVPEPGTLVMLLGLAASLAVYGWKRRGSR